MIIIIIIILCLNKYVSLQKPTPSPLIRISSAEQPFLLEQHTNPSWDWQIETVTQTPTKIKPKLGWRSMLGGVG